MQTSDLILISNRGVIASIIKFITKSQFSHVEVVERINDSNVLVGADFKGIKYKSIDTIKDQYICILRHKKWRQIPFNEIQEEIIIEKIHSKVGTKYDFVSLFSQIYYQTFHKWLGRKTTADKKFYCSEFGAWINGVSNYYELSPQDLYTHKDFYMIYEGKL